MIFSKRINSSLFIYIMIIIFILVLKPKIFRYKNSKNPINRALVVYLIIIYAIVAYYSSLFLNIFNLQ